MSESESVIHPPIDLAALRHPPPWKAHFRGPADHGPRGGVWLVTTDRGDPEDEYDVTEDPCEATARLVAAAPEMLACLRSLATYFDEQIEVTDSPGTLGSLRCERAAIEAAVARAEGRNP